MMKPTRIVVLIILLMVVALAPGAISWWKWNHAVERCATMPKADAAKFEECESQPK